MAATSACFDVPMDGATLAAACQWAENHIAAAPCGIMDQMTSALGRADRLLRLRCQPAAVEGYVSIPAGYRFYGIDSGIRHAVTGADYGTVRTAAFMGYRMIADLVGLPVSVHEHRVGVRDDQWGGYLANIPPTEYSARFAERLPTRVHGAEFLARYAGITDSVTRVDPDQWYPVRAATSHPVHEHARVTRFAELLETGMVDGAEAPSMGALMFESHASYSACGLGSDGTDQLVQLVTAAGPAQGCFGAKITRRSPSWCSGAASGVPLPRVSMVTPTAPAGAATGVLSWAVVRAVRSPKAASATTTTTETRTEKRRMANSFP